MINRKIKLVKIQKTGPNVKVSFVLMSLRLAIFYLRKGFCLVPIVFEVLPGTFQLKLYCRLPTVDFLT